jgi:hypothetical protein
MLTIGILKPIIFLFCFLTIGYDSTKADSDFIKVGTGPTKAGSDSMLNIIKYNFYI